MRGALIKQLSSCPVRQNSVKQNVERKTVYKATKLNQKKNYSDSELALSQMLDCITCLLFALVYAKNSPLDSLEAELSQVCERGL